MQSNKSTMKKTSLASMFSVAAVLFGWHAGGGFATGNQANQFFVSLGWIGPIAAVCAILLLTLTVRQAIIMYNQKHLSSYKELLQNLYHPFDKLEIVFEIYFYTMVLMATSSSIAGAGTLFEDAIHVPYIIAIIIIGILLLILTMLGADIVLKASSVMSVLILVTSLSIFIYGIITNTEEIRTAFSNNLSLSSSVPKAILKAFQYAGFQCACIPTLVVCSTVLKSKKQSKGAMWISFAMNSVALCLSIFMLNGWKAVYTSIEGGSVIPTLTVCKEMNIKVMLWFYYICLFLCFMSTGVSAVFGVVSKFENSRILKNHIDSSKKRRAIVAVIVMAIAITVSLAGLTNIVKYGYGYCGYIGIAMVVVPFLTVGVYKNSKCKNNIFSSDN